MSKRILIINPGNSSTKLALFDDESEVFRSGIEHSNGDLMHYPHIYDQREYRRSLILDMLEQYHIPLDSIDAVIGRGGLLKPVAAGVYHVSPQLVEDAKNAAYGEHASNLGPVLSQDLAALAGCPAFIADPVTVDELIPEARLSGLKELPRTSQAHALNCRAVAMRTAEELGKPFSEMRMILVHLGSGVSVVPFCFGKMIDSNNALEGGPMCPDRAGTLPSRSLVILSCSGKYDKDALLKKINREGGLCDHLGVKDLRKALEMMDQGDEYAALVLRAMSYQIGKEVGAMATTLNGQVDCIVITGGMAYSPWLMEDLQPRIAWIAPVIVHAGENEIEALRDSALRVLSGQEEAQQY